METTNLSKIKREKMLNTIKEIKNKVTDEDTLQNLSLIENELRKKKFGLIWEEHVERVDDELVDFIPTFINIEKNEINNNDLTDDNNFLIEGDNLHSLYLLNKTHKNKIDVIYIDPPYNTGRKDFKYNDNFIEKEDSYRHSKWLSFMEKRLKMSKKLLKEDGLIFISIDDKELYQLKLLCDEIFGEDNFISNIVVETANGVFGKRAAMINKTFVKVKDYVLVYCNNKQKNKGDFCPLYMGTNDYFDTHYSTVLDKNLNKTTTLDFLKSNKNIVELFKKYDLKLSMDNISKVMAIDPIFNEFIIGNAEKIYQDVAFSLKIPDELENKLNKGGLVRYKNYILFKTNGGKGTIRHYLCFKESLKVTDDFIPEYRKSVAIGDLWEGFDADMKNVLKEGNMDFDEGKKPVRLIKQLLKWVNKKDAVVLDFFAGSGTTGHAVLELNKDDSGSRKFILCTNNENNICEEITYKRLSNVINGYGKFDALNTNLIYYRASNISRENTDEYNLSLNLLNNTCNLIQLENGRKIDNKKIVVMFDEGSLDAFVLETKNLEICNKLYLSADILLTSNQEDTFRKHNIETYIIPEYYFSEELAEVE